MDQRAHKFTFHIRSESALPNNIIRIDATLKNIAYDQRYADLDFDYADVIAFHDQRDIARIARTSYNCRVGGGTEVNVTYYARVVEAKHAARNA